jgi:hypothetical protein
VDCRGQGRARNLDIGFLLPRNLSPAVLSAIAAKTLQLAMFVELAFADNTLYLFGGIGSFTPAGPAWSPTSTFPYGQTFTGLGWLGKLSGIPQTTTVQAQNITLSLSGIPAALVAEVVSQVRVTGTGTVWLGFFDSSGNLLEDPVQLFAGSLDVPSLTDGGDTSTISITCENPLLSLNLSPDRRFDDPDQQLYFPGDLGMSFVEKLQNLQLFWPAPVIAGSPYAVSATVTPATVDIAVGGTALVTVTVTYSDGSTYSVPSGAGSGPHFAVAIATSNPKVATFSYSTGDVTGISPGECSIMARMPYPLGFATGPAGQWRQVASIFVHS